MLRDHLETVDLRFKYSLTTELPFSGFPSTWNLEILEFQMVHRLGSNAWIDQSWQTLDAVLIKVF